MGSRAKLIRNAELSRNKIKSQGARTQTFTPPTYDETRKSVFRKVVKMLQGAQFEGETSRFYPESIEKLTIWEERWILDNWGFLSEAALRIKEAYGSNSDRFARIFVQIWDLGDLPKNLDPNLHVVSFHPSANMKRKSKSHTKVVGDWRERQKQLAGGFRVIPVDEEVMESLWYQYK
jgi:hypothetical protein